MKGGLLLLLSLLSGTGLASENYSRAAVQWLERMNQAVMSLDYEGHFVYQCEKSLEAMYLRHEIGEDGPRESLSSLTGVPREVIRDNDRITIITNNNGQIHISQQPAAGKLSPLKSLQPERLKENYQIELGRKIRIAGRPGMVINLMPHDDLRYGYRLTLDQMSALPLDLTVVDNKGVVQSRIMFTDLKISDTQIPAAQSKAVSMQEAAQPVVLASLDNTPKDPAQNKPREKPLSSLDVHDSVWNFQTLPAGFVLIQYQKSPASAVEHFVFSDGLATISAYLEPLESDQAFEGYTNLGSVRVYGRRLKNYQLTLVGEVPEKTLQRVAASIEYHEP